MPTNKKEYIIFNVFMVTFMVSIMSTYNIALSNGFSFETIKIAWLGFPLGFLVAFVCEALIVSKYVVKVASKILKPNDSIIKKRAVISLLVVLGMATIMSLYGAIMTVGFSENTISVWLGNIGRNLIVAYPLAFFGGFFVTFVFRKLFPHGTIVEFSQVK